MPENFSNRKFTRDCYKLLENMVFALYEEDRGGEAMTTQKVQRTVDKLSQHPDKGRIELLFMGEELVGYAILIYQWSNEYGGDFLLVDEIYLKPAWRGQGIGSRYIGRLENSEMNSVGLLLEVTEENERAKQLYQLLGFKPDKNHHMAKIIS